MSGSSSYVLDTNIILQLLKGDRVLADIINNKALYVSFITEMELLSYHKLLPEEEIQIRSLLNDCYVIEMNHPLKLSAISIRKNNKMKLPDSIIAATSEHLNIPLLTSDVEFNKLNSLQILLYNKS